MLNDWHVTITGRSLSSKAVVLKHSIPGTAQLIFEIGGNRDLLLLPDFVGPGFDPEGIRAGSQAVEAQRKPLVRFNSLKHPEGMREKD